MTAKTQNFIQNPNDTSEYLLKIGREYSIYVAMNRAIPSVIDGFKDGQRKALWLMKDSREKVKVLSLSGTMIQSNMYVHGDASANESISKMAAPYLNNVRWLDGVGNFGTRTTPKAFGAARYVYVKKSKALDKIMLTDDDLVPLKENYDGSALEPVSFLPLIPTVLLNGINGIAVGWATSILPRKLDDVIDATLKAIKKEKLPSLPPHYESYNCDVTHHNNQWHISGKVVRQSLNTICVTELPPDFSLESFKDDLDKLEEKGSISEYVDRSADTINIEIKFKRGTVNDWTDNDFIDFFKLKSKLNEQIVVVNWNSNGIRVYQDPQSLIKDFVEWRKQFYYQRYQKLMKEADIERNFYKLLFHCFEHKLPEYLANIRSKSALEEKVMEILISEETVSDDEETINQYEKSVEKIVHLPSYRWTEEEFNKTKEKLNELNLKISEYSAILADSKRIEDIYYGEVLDLKNSKI